MRNKNFTISRFYCPKCNSAMTVPRIRNRERNHHKTLWCPVCQKIQVMTEVRECDYVKNMLGEVI